MLSGSCIVAQRRSSPGLGIGPIVSSFIYIIARRVNVFQKALGLAKQLTSWLEGVEIPIKVAYIQPAAGDHWRTVEKVLGIQKAEERAAS